MPSFEPVRIFVENRGEVLMLEGIFRDLKQRGEIEVEMGWTASSVISLAEFSLLRRPAQKVAIVLNCSDDPDELRGPAERILSRVASREFWHVSLAIPDMFHWVTADRGFAPVGGALTSKYDVAVTFNDWAKNGRFDLEAADSRDAEFLGLHRFVMSHNSTTAGVA
jgi:hypothetical protein